MGGSLHLKMEHVKKKKNRAVYLFNKKNLSRLFRGSDKKKNSRVKKEQGAKKG